jgi:D-alanyl-D-alanine carboxypeptidase/D-alanyl-D-alanine-endopeptidase (penicillin-binding protein 4)
MSAWLGAERRRRRPRRASNPLAVVGGVGAAGAALLLASVVVVDRLADRVVARVEPAATEAAVSPVVTARRVPMTLSVTTRLGRVERSLASSIGALPTGSCATVDWEGERLMAVDPSEPLVPASAMKVVTAAAAIDVLGPDHTFVTSVHGEIDASGAATSLWLVGGGDPLLVTAGYPSTEKYPTFNQTSLESLADQVVAAGLRTVSGSIAGVDTRYDAQRFVESWPSSFQFVEGGPLGALMVNDGVVPGVATRPSDPALAAAQVFGGLLADRGVVVAGGWTRDVLPAGAPEITKVSSAPLVNQLQAILVNSDNNASELLLKEVGLKASGSGSTSGGAAAVLGLLESWGLAEGVVVADGSGLSRENRVPCSVFADLLERLADRLPGLLAVAGESGTLRSIFEGESVDGRLLGKTGTLSGVKSLVGYVPVENGSPVRFTILMNSAGIDNQSRYRPVWYSISSAMARASSTPSAEQLSP